ncbi:hypothetical protein BOX15_Mlig017314g2 [Macrostomum lignano]|uniref:Nuclear receptor domain-containing protein n=1 Tax=Macrostomum lignano TaxID=282301 RepID=A0A267H6E4_9PLAT|nr:hypothetical protein BOX15_Mlig017314g2 [Macrostomum lignano]
MYSASVSSSSTSSLVSPAAAAANATSAAAAATGATAEDSPFFSAFNGTEQSTAAAAGASGLGRASSPDTSQSASESAASAAADSVVGPRSPHRKRRYKMQLSQPLDQYRCHVCGDKALGFNFDAVTCESCKAFFRRNAFKNMDMKCNFSGSCSISINTRKFCSPCRLKKCFLIGMKKELILNESQLQQRRQKTLCNRNRRYVTTATTASASPISRQSSTTGDPGRRSVCAYKLEESSFYPDETALSEPSVEPPQRPTVLTLLEECSDGLASSSSECSWDLYRPLSDTCTQLMEGIRVSLDNVVNNVNETDSEQISSTATDKATSLEMPFTITLSFVQRFVSFVKCLPEFNYIDMDDRVNLIKGGVFHFILMRGVAIYNPELDSFTFLSKASSGHRHSVPLAALTQSLSAYPSGQQLVERYRRFIIGYHRASSGDQMALTLLQLIEFYNPSRPLLRNMHRIDRIQAGYIMLLKRHIESVQPTQQARRVFFDLMNRLSELDSIATDFSQLCHVVGFRCEELNPLLLEIFELSNGRPGGSRPSSLFEQPLPPPPPPPPPPYTMRDFHQHHQQLYAAAATFFHQQQQPPLQPAPHHQPQHHRQHQRSHYFKCEPTVPR